MNGRQFTQMILLTPGAVPHEDGQQAAFIIPIGGGGLSPNVNGSRGRQNNFTLDGSTDNNLMTNDYTISPPPDAIQEFTVQTHITDAQVGMSSGANVNVVTKQGSDAVHGDVWEFLRNDKFDAANFFDNIAGQAKPAFRMNQFGLTLGGPVILPKPGGSYDGRKKKTYFFGYYEGFRSTQGFTEFNNVPSLAELGGDFSDLLTNTRVAMDPLGRPVPEGQIYNPYTTRQVTAGSVDPSTGLTAQSTGLVRDAFPGNQIPTAMLDADALIYLKAFYPLPNLKVGPNVFPNFAIDSPNIITNDQFGLRVDHTFGNNDTLFGVFYFTNPHNTQPNSLLLGTSVLTNPAKQISAGYTHLFNPTLLLTVHFGYSYTNWYDGNLPAGVHLLDATNQENFFPVKDNLPEVPAITLSPRLGGTGQFAIPLGPNRSDTVTADIQKVQASHTLNAGLMFYRIHSFDDGWGMNQNFDQFPTSAITGPGVNASSTGDGLASMLLNLPSGLNGFLGQTGADFHDLWQGYYLQDKWQASKKLSIQIGMRYDFVPPPQWANNRVGGFSNECGCYVVTQPFGTLYPHANVRHDYFDPQYRGFQPRFGLAYSVSPKIVVRGGFGIFQDHDGSFIQETQDMRIPWPWGVDPNIIELNRGIPNTFFDHPPPATSFFPSPTQSTHPYIFSGVDNRNKIPTTNEWNLGIQAQFTPSLTMELTYVGMKTDHNQLNLTDNTVLPNAMGPGPFEATKRLPYPAYGQFGYDENESYGNYNSLQFKAEKRLSQGLSFLGAYTWSHCLDINSDPYGDVGPQDPYNLRAEYSSCDSDFRQVFSLSYVYQLPFGRGQHFGRGWDRGLNAVLGGWQTSGIESAQTGPPFTVQVGFDNSNTGVGSDRAELIGNPVPSGFVQNWQHWDDAASFAVPAPYTYGDTAREFLRGPGHNTFDFSLMKNFNFKEAKYVQFRAEAFNIFNRVNLATPGQTASPGYANLGGTGAVAITSPNPFQILSAGPARIVQFSLKLVF